MPTLGAGFLLHAATVAGLGESCPPGIDVHDGPASTLSQAGQALDKHPRRAELDRFAIAPLPGAIGEVFQLKGIPQHHQSMGQLPVAALAGGRQLPVHLASTGLDLPLACGDMPALAAPLDLPPLVVVGRVIGAALPVELPIQPSQGFGIGRHLGTEGLEERLLLRDHRDGTRPQVQPDDSASQLVVGLLPGHALADQLG